MLKLFREFGFTKGETVIMFFLVLAFLLGLAVKYFGFKKSIGYNYTKYDQKFESKLKSDFNELDTFSYSDMEEAKVRKLKMVADSLVKDKKNMSSLKELSLSFDKKISINSGEVPDLMRLPGIGETIAERIIEYRELNKGFKKLEEIMNVKGIGRKKFEKIKDYIVVE